MELDEIQRFAGEGNLIGYFGYGSLVNPVTHRTKIFHYERASLKGFARSWQARPDQAAQPIALLSAAPAASEYGLDGLLVFDHAENLASLDEREAGYDRLAINHGNLALANGDMVPNCPLYVYSGRPPYNPDQQHYILQSYLDAVLQGYLHQYGEQGVRAFIERTGGFDTALATDRNNPLYPRSVELTAEEVELIDSLTAFMTRVDGVP